MNTAEKIAVHSSVKTELTPGILAQAFWAMDSTQQAGFFAALADEVSKTESAYGYGEMQWCYMADAIRKSREASRMYMALSAFAFEYWPQRNEYEFVCETQS